VAVGRIDRAHGVKGEVSVIPLSSVASRFQTGSRLFVGDREHQPLTVRAARPHQRRMLVAFEGIADRTTAEKMRGQYLFAPSDSAPPLPEGEYWTHQLLGCDVETATGRHLGRLSEVIHTRANDVWVASEKDRQVLIPALRDVVVSVDVEGQRIVVREVPGLIPA